MTPQQVLESITDKYEILCFENLAEYNQNSGSLYRLFHKLYQSTYNSNQRLVFYTASPPSDKLLAHLKRAADTIDISRCFILVCGAVHTSEGNDIEFLSCSIDAAGLGPDNLLDLDVLCPLPFSHLAVMEQGRAKGCCLSEGSLGSAVNQTISELFYGPQLSQVRKDFLENKKSPGCKVCWNLEQQQIPSTRQWKLKFYEKQLFVDQWIENLELRSLDLRPSNICNFKCRICSPISSSLFAVESLNHAQDPATKIRLQEIIKKGQWFDNTEFFQELVTYLPNMLQMDFFGGEPFLLKQLPKLLQTAIDLGVAKNIRLHFNSNASIWPEDLLPLLLEFKQIDIALSIDNIGSKFELERGGTWQDIENNIKKFAALGSHFDVYLMPTVNIQNVLYLPELFDFAVDLGLGVNCNFLNDPVHLSIDQMTPSAKALVVSKLQNQPHDMLRTISNRIQQSPGSDGKKFVAAMTELDQRRNQDFRKTHFEIANAMGYMLHYDNA